MCVGIATEKPETLYSELEARLDGGIRDAVKVLRNGGIRTFESCEGGEGHAHPEPIVYFHGGIEMGALAYAIAVYHGLPVSEIRRCWDVSNNELEGPFWAIVFSRKIQARETS